MRVERMHDMAPTRILKEQWEVIPKLIDFQLDIVDLLSVRDMAIGAAADATAFHPANAPGTFSYQYGTFGLRDKIIGDAWALDRSSGVEGIRNESKRIKVAYANVNLACNDDQQPQPRSAKGSGAERLCAQNGLFDSMPNYYPGASGSEPGWSFYYLMVAPDGAAELSCPIVAGGTFKYFRERMYLSDGRDLDEGPDLSLDDGDIANDFDPQVERK